MTPELKTIFRSSTLALAIFGAPLVVSGQNVPPAVAFIQVSSPERRLQYLGNARIWSDPGNLTPQDIFAGPPLNDASGLDAASLAGRPLPCTFAKPGVMLGGNTPKFLCMPATGRAIRVKYTDDKGGNREVFAEVAASRLLWALGFFVDAAYPLSVDCRACPRDPMTGTGSRASRVYVALYQPRYSELVMVDHSDPNQGWRWGELDRAIASLPDGPLRTRQRTHFDALTLAGVLLQHGDRKPEQQRLGCAGDLNWTAGDVHPLVRLDDQAFNLPVFFENSGASACASPIVVVQDVGATYGGAGRTTNRTTAKMHLDSWAARPVFRPVKGSAAGVVPECRGQITVSLTAGSDSGANPRIGEAGRLFLLEQLHKLTDDHLRALLQAARVEQMGVDHNWRDPRANTVHHGIEAWVAAFKEKVRQIEERRCAA